jgi:hypothetical protein
VIVDYIDTHRNRFGIAAICAVLAEYGASIAPSTYYATIRKRVSPADIDDANHANLLFDRLRGNRGVYGWRKLLHAARRTGLRIRRNQVERLMRVVGIASVVRGATPPSPRGDQRQLWSAPGPGQAVLVDPDRPGPVGVADFSYVWTLSGFFYVALLTDVYSRRILAGGSRPARRRRWCCRCSSRRCSPGAGRMLRSPRPACYTVDALLASRGDIADGAPVDREDARLRLADAQKRLDRLTAAIEAGAGPRHPDRASQRRPGTACRAQNELNAAPPAPSYLNRAEIHAIVDSLGDVGASLARANPERIQRINQSLRVEMVYDHKGRTVDVRIRPLRGFVNVSEGDLRTNTRLALPASAP